MPTNLKDHSNRYGLIMLVMVSIVAIIGIVVLVSNGDRVRGVGKTGDKDTLAGEAFRSGAIQLPPIQLPIKQPFSQDLMGGTVELVPPFGNGTTLRYHRGTMSMGCPGFTEFSSHSTYPNNFCLHNPTNTAISSWVLYSYPSGHTRSVLHLYVGKTRDGCTGTYCTRPGYLNVFYTIDDVRNRNARWVYVGATPIAQEYWPQYTTDIQLLGFGLGEPLDIKGILLTRSGAGDNYPDLRWIGVPWLYRG